MQKKNLEEILQQKADQVETRDFSEIWSDIKDTVNKTENLKRFQWKKSFSLALASVAVVACIALTPIIINGLKPAPEQVYFIDGLESKPATEQEMFNGLSQAQINHVDLSNYIISGTILYWTEDLQIKGAEFVLNNDPTTFIALIQLCDSDVDMEIDFEELYDSSIQVNSVDVKYKLKSSSGTYDYSVYAVKNGVQYVIEYTGLTDNLTDFLNEFFA